jgi:hypothetical protein
MNLPEEEISETKINEGEAQPDQLYRYKQNDTNLKVFGIIMI